MNVHDLLNKLEAQEQDFLSSEILSPVLPGRGVTVRIAGVVCRLEVDDANFSGWAILQPVDTHGALIVRPATRGEIQKYLQLLPAVPLLALAKARSDATHDDQARGTWYALPAHSGDRRFGVTKPVPVFHCEDSMQPFETMVARFDGSHFWYERMDARRNPALAAYLRESFLAELPPERLQKKGLSGEERAAYVWTWQSAEAAKAAVERRRAAAQQRRDRARQTDDEWRLATALEHAQGQLVGFIERGDVYTVTYRVHNHTHTSTVRKNDLTVLTSGICLSGRDGDFDLTSVVGVMREAARLDRYDD